MLRMNKEYISDLVGATTLFPDSLSIIGHFEYIFLIYTLINEKNVSGKFEKYPEIVTEPYYEERI